MSTVAIILGNRFFTATNELQEQLDLYNWKAFMHRSCWEGPNGERIVFANNMERLCITQRETPCYEHGDLYHMNSKQKAPLKEMARERFGDIKPFGELKLNELMEKSNG